MIRLDPTEPHAQRYLGMHSTFCVMVRPNREDRPMIWGTYGLAPCGCTFIEQHGDLARGERFDLSQIRYFTTRPWMS